MLAHTIAEQSASLQFGFDHIPRCQGTKANPLWTKGLARSTTISHIHHVMHESAKMPHTQGASWGGPYPAGSLIALGQLCFPLIGSTNVLIPSQSCLPNSPSACQQPMLLLSLLLQLVGLQGTYDLEDCSKSAMSEVSMKQISVSSHCYLYDEERWHLFFWWSTGCNCAWDAQPLIRRSKANKLQK